ncbi:unnamed protein product, partial [Coregonus sp. 'balchen']
MSFSLAADLAYHTKKKHSEGRTHSQTESLTSTRLKSCNSSQISGYTKQDSFSKNSNKCVCVMCGFLGKMYLCQYCEALFAQSIELTRHVSTQRRQTVPRLLLSRLSLYLSCLSYESHLLHSTARIRSSLQLQLLLASTRSPPDPLPSYATPSLSALPRLLFTPPHRLDQTHAANLLRHLPRPTTKHDCAPALRTNHARRHPATHAEMTADSPRAPLLRPTGHSAASPPPYSHRMFDSDGMLVGNPDLPSVQSVCGRVCSVCMCIELLSPVSSDSSVVKCLYCPALFPCEPEITEHFSQEGAAFGCSLCPLVCPCQLQLQKPFLSCHIGTIEEQEQTTSQTVIETEEDTAGGAEQ